MKIKAKFTLETANWSDKKGYHNRVYCDRFKEIEMEIENNDKGAILRFIGGPTGYESYYVLDLLKSNPKYPRTGDFCICGGTVNSWERCIVQWEDVKKFLKDEGWVLTEVSNDN